MSAGLTSARDVSMRNKYPGSGMDCTTLFLCGHKGSRHGAYWRRPAGQQVLFIRCAKCQAAKLALAADQVAA